MDVPYSQQQHARRKNRSAANLQHLSLAPLTPRLPLRDDVDVGVGSTSNSGGLAESSSAYDGGAPTVLHRIPSYIQGRSAPSTSRLLSKSPPARTPSRSRSRGGDLNHNGRRSSLGGSVGVGVGVGVALPKSRSTTHLLGAAGAGAGTRASGAGSRPPSVAARHHRRRKTDHLADRSLDGRSWLFRAGVLVTSEARESKGQSWLTARQSSTSLTGLRDAEEAEDAVALERELAREREYRDRIASSRRGSLHHDDNDGVSPPGLWSSGSRMGSRMGSHMGSRAHSRAPSRAGSRVTLLTPLERRRSLEAHSGAGEAGYFDYAGAAEAGDEHDAAAAIEGPDFVNLDEKLEALELNQRDTGLEDEDHVRRLVKREKAGGLMGSSWLGSVFGWSLFSVNETEDEAGATEGDEEGGEEEEENDEDDDDDDDDEDDDDDDDETEDDGEQAGEGQKEGPAAEQGEGSAQQPGRRQQRRRRRAAVGWNRRGTAAAWTGRPRFEGDAAQPADDGVPPPPAANEGTWQDAAWLLSVVSKVIL